MKDKDFEELWNSGATARKYRQCHISDQELDKIIGNAIDRDKQTRQKHFTIRKRPYLYPAMAVACVAALMVALWQVCTNSVFIPNTPEALQPSASVLVAQAEASAEQQTLEISTTAPTYPATTDNEIKNTAVKPTYKHTETIYAEHKGDIEEMSDALYGNTAAADIAEQEPQPILLAEAESKIHAEQYYADTAYMIADAGEVYDELEMYCSTRCSSNEVFISFDKGMGKKIMI